MIITQLKIHPALKAYTFALTHVEVGYYFIRHIILTYCVRHLNSSTWICFLMNMNLK